MASSFISSGFTTMAVINPPEKELAKFTSVRGSMLEQVRLWLSKLGVNKSFCAKPRVQFQPIVTSFLL
jgi:hypothetical protein